jgi:uncharacterized protein (TIGR03067 family)
MTAERKDEAAPARPSAPLEAGTAPVRPGRPAAGARTAPRQGGLRIEKGSLRLFRLFGIDVFVHWSWFIAAYFLFQPPDRGAAPPGLRFESHPAAWHAAQCLTLFAIVLLHEFGHSLACRSVGGRAERIYLWPLGGAAFVSPPPRPGPFLWSIAAGPLVNLLLVPFTVGILLMAYAAGIDETWPDAWLFLVFITAGNVGLLVFNLLPIFPLDGGQILQGLLWFFLGRARSLMVVAGLAIPVAVVLGAAALITRNWLLAAVFGFVLLASLGGLARAGALLRILKAPRRAGFRCPACGAAPPVGEFWVCSRCLMRYDTFEQRTACPRCGNHPQQTMCTECLQSRPAAEWAADAASTEPAPARPTLPAARGGARVSVLERMLWAASLAGLVLAAGWLVAGRDHLVAVLVLALGGAILGATQAEALARGRKARAALKRLRGTWRLVELDGKDLTGADAPAVRMTVSGHVFTERTGDRQTARGNFWLDATREPAQINLVPNQGPTAGTTYQGVCELNGNVWRVCVGNPGAPRPTALASEPDRQRLMVYRRE